MLKVKEKPYEFMVFPTVQKAWIEGKGILLWAALFFVEFGASLFLVSSFFKCLWGQTAGWLIAGVLGGGCHFFFLGHPLRAYLAIKRPKSAWISRGLLVISLFQFLGLVHLILAYFSTPVFWVMVAADVMAVAAVLYGGYELADVKSIPTWHSSLLPIQLFARSFFLALGVMLAIYLIGGVETIGYGLKTKKWLNIVLLINIFLFIAYLINLANEEGKKRLALDMMLKGDLKLLFWPWVGIGGMIIPLLLVAYSLVIGVASTPAGVLLIAVILQLIADPVMRYCMMRSGSYPALLPGWRSEAR
ncbi:MAG: dimethyl sulfoxide reductase anchor subunit [Desulfobacterales bacterium]|nr:dimethyl sulfoxide reductase anchor subunit [Desulfobacterales bacterium]